MPRYSFEGGDDERDAFTAGSSLTRDDNPPPLTTQPDPIHASRQVMPGPTAHPDSAFQKLRAQRIGIGAYATDSAPVLEPPSYQDALQRHGAPQPAHHLPTTNITPGAAIVSPAAAGGVAGIADGVAEQNLRQSVLDAFSSPNHPQQAYQHRQPSPPLVRPAPIAYPGASSDRNSASSVQQLNAAAEPMAQSSPYGLYTDDPYHSYAGRSTSDLGYFDPNDIQDDGDDGLEYGRNPQGRKSMLSLGNSSHRSREHGAAAATAAGGAAGAAGLMGAIGGLATGRTSRPVSGQYNSVQNVGSGDRGVGGEAYDLGGRGGGAEKSAWLAQERALSKKRLMIIIGVGVVIAAAIALGVYFGWRSTRAASDSQKTATGAGAADDLDINSSEIKALLNNKNLHKVFPGMDYTPMNTQYPDCVHDPPSQNNITRDVAVMSQLTNTIRLYGTDCNQTQMLLHAVERLQLNNTVKIWMGVWQDGNASTNARQLSQMYDILDVYGADPFKGIIVANEILFRKEMTITQLSTVLKDVRANLTAKSISLPIATSDLGDDWTPELAAQSDYIMSNIHPFFAGVNAKQAASWTWSFWDTNNRPLNTDLSKNIIAETGWPSGGGTDCGTDQVTDCPNGAVAGVAEMNQFMSDWVCQALTNGTQYFWFSGFDEPWKIRYNTKTENWEDKWGLMDVNRNLKGGVTIPDCGGQEVGAA